jgi:ribosomal protein L37AE/L43A
MKLIKDLGTIKEKHYKRFGIYECPDCKEEITIRTDSINAGQEKCKSCSHQTHGGRNTRLYDTWRNMKSRCYKEINNRYQYYGAKGVTVCDEWKNDFAAFQKWSYENGYKDDLDLDKDRLCHELKISPAIYSPKTCIWVTKAENNSFKKLKRI